MGFWAGVAIGILVGIVWTFIMVRIGTALLNREAERVGTNGRPEDPEGVGMSRHALRNLVEGQARSDDVVERGEDE